MPAPGTLGCERQFGSQEVVMSVSAIETAEGIATEVPPEVPIEPVLSVVLFSGTDDRLEAASVLIAGAVAMGRPVHVLLQYLALEAFRADRIHDDHGLASEASPEGSQRLWLMK